MVWRTDTKKAFYIERFLMDYRFCKSFSLHKPLGLVVLRLDSYQT